LWKRRRSRNDPVEAFIAQVPEPQRTIMRRLRDRIRTADPAVERASNGKRLFSRGPAPFLSCPLRATSFAVFKDGHDGEGLLEGTGKAMCT
jgi:hypothetical protein